MKTIIFSCSERQDNLSIRAAKAVARHLPNSTVIDLRDYPLNNIGIKEESKDNNFIKLLTKLTTGQKQLNEINERLNCV